MDCKEGAVYLQLPQLTAIKSIIRVLKQNYEGVHGTSRNSLVKEVEIIDEFLKSSHGSIK